MLPGSLDVLQPFVATWRRRRSIFAFQPEWLRGISDVGSIRSLGIGVLIAARLDRQPGFHLLRDSAFVPYDVPDTCADLEVCGEVDGHPVVRTDRTAWLRARRPWWRTRLD